MDATKKWLVDRRRPERTGPHVYSFYLQYRRDIERYTCPTPEEERALGLRIRSGDESAIQEMIVRNLRLVETIARDFEDSGMSLFDLISEGNIGLMVAVRRFDPDKGKFSAYAHWYIKHYIKRALANKARTIRIPVHMLSKLALLAKAARTLRESLEREPTDEELAVEMNICSTVVSGWRTSLHSLISLDSEVINPNVSGFTRLGDTIADTNAEIPGDRLALLEDLDLMQRFLSELEEREQTVLKMRYGLPEFDREHTLEETGQAIGLTRERARQIQEEALEKLLFKIKMVDILAYAGKSHTAPN